MEDKEKQITEMAKTMCFQANSCTVKSCVQVNCEKTWLAENLYNAGYRKFPEDSVVISRDNYNRLKKDNEDIDTFCRDIGYIRRDNGNAIVTFKEFQDYVELQNNKASKETAEKIYLQAKAVVGATKYIVQGRQYLHIDVLKEIVKSCGVEIKE